VRELLVSTMAVVAGSAGTVAFAAVVADGYAAGPLAVSVVLLIGPAWALTFALASAEDDFAGAERTREQWLRVLPWTFVLAPLVLPNVLLLGQFMRDSRADGGRSAFSWDRMRPGDAERDHHWPG
jgi:hypothetical protein